MDSKNVIIMQESLLSQNDAAAAAVAEKKTFLSRAKKIILCLLLLLAAMTALIVFYSFSMQGSSSNASSSSSNPDSIPTSTVSNSTNDNSRLLEYSTVALPGTAGKKIGDYRSCKPDLDWCSDNWECIKVSKKFTCRPKKTQKKNRKHGHKKKGKHGHKKNGKHGHKKNGKHGHKKNGKHGPNLDGLPKVWEQNGEIWITPYLVKDGYTPATWTTNPPGGCTASEALMRVGWPKGDIRQWTGEMKNEAVYKMAESVGFRVLSSAYAPGSCFQHVALTNQDGKTCYALVLDLSYIPDPYKGKNIGDVSQVVLDCFGGVPDHGHIKLKKAVYYGPYTQAVPPGFPEL